MYRCTGRVTKAGKLWIRTAMSVFEIMASSMVEWWNLWKSWHLPFADLLQVQAWVE